MQDDIILNNTNSLKQWLLLFYKEIKEIKHIGNYVFEADTNFGTIKVLTTPVNPEQTKIKILRLL